MKAIIVDDETIALDTLYRQLLKYKEIDNIYTFSNPKNALEWIKHKENRIQIAFLDICMEPINGLLLAQQLQIFQPQCEIFFVTGERKYAIEAFKIHASGYLLKPVKEKDLREEIDYVLKLHRNKEDSYIVKIQCFGKFEVFFKSIPIKFKRTKTKELLAYLVDLRGAAANTGEICSVLWEDAVDTPSIKAQVRVLISDLRRTFESIGKSDVLNISRNQFAIHIDKVDCDYYKYLEQDPKALLAYRGEYMSQYSWSEMTLSKLK